MNETHPLFPSGEWEGFYTYTYGPQAHRDPMYCVLEFKNGGINGNGSDAVGAFIWSGTYDIAQQTCALVKQYIGQHQVMYHGHADETGIWGNWDIPPFSKGGFHIWPKKRSEERENRLITAWY